MAKTRVLVVEDSLTVREHLIEVLSGDSDLEIVGEAGDGKRAIELCQALRPDVVTLDMILPVMSGVAVTEYIMAFCPTPILVVSASRNRGEHHKTYDALSAGALDVLEKRTDDQSDEVWERTLISSVKRAARIKVITHIRARVGSPTTTPVEPLENTYAHEGLNGTRLIAIGGSTGSPAAVSKILRLLPPSFPVPILLIVHISRPFGAAFAEWLDAQSTMPVHYAQDGDALPTLGQSGVIMAPPDLHLTVERNRLRLTSGPERNSCRPSVDVLFESLAREWGPQTTACLLTGMGKDGAAGLLSLRRAGAVTVAQDEASSVVFGMPKEAIQIGAASQILAPAGIASALAELAPPNGWRKNT